VPDARAGASRAQGARPGRQGAAPPVPPCPPRARMRGLWVYTRSACPSQPTSRPVAAPTSSPADSRMSGRRGVRADLPRPQSEGSRAAQAAADSPAPLLQLPHVDMEAVKRLGRKRMRALADLAALAPDERVAQLTAAGAAPRRARSRACSPTRTARARTAASRDAHVGGARRGSPPPRAASGMPLARRALGVPKVAACRGRPTGGRGRPGALVGAREAGRTSTGADRGAPRGRPVGGAGGGGRDRAERRAEHQRERRGAPCAGPRDPASRCPAARRAKHGAHAGAWCPVMR